VDFLSKHYEKLILLGMLLFFIFAMVDVLSIARQTGEVKESDLNIPRRDPDYKPQNAKDAAFQPSKLWETGKLVWAAGASRDQAKGAAFYSDFTEFPGLAVCMVGKNDKGQEEGCGALVPRFYFSGKPCPNCGRILKVPPDRPKMRRNVITADDSDGDGMPNDYEKKYNLDVNNPYDALYDADGDGFSNIYEMEHNTDPTNARNHPPLWYRLRFVAVRRVVLPVSFRALNTNKQTDPQRWDIQLNLKQKNSRTGKETERTQMSRLNSTIQIEGRRYRIMKVERILSDSSGGVRKKDAPVAGGVRDESEDKAQDLSKIYLEEDLNPSQRNKGLTPDKLEMQIGKPAYSSDRRPIFEDVGLPEGKRSEHIVRVGERFRLGNYQTGTTDYILHSFDEKKMIAVLRLARAGGKQDPMKDELGKAMIVTRDGEIPEDSRVIEPIAGTVAPKEAANEEREDIRRSGRPGRRRR